MILGTKGTQILENIDFSSSLIVAWTDNSYCETYIQLSQGAASTWEGILNDTNVCLCSHFAHADSPMQEEGNCEEKCLIMETC